MQDGRRVPLGRYANEVDVIGFAAEPLLDMRLEGETPRAAEHEDLGDLDLALVGARGLSRQDGVVLAGFERRGGGRLGTDLRPGTGCRQES
jgi:hypothetical protein